MRDQANDRTTDDKVDAPVQRKESPEGGLSPLLNLQRSAGNAAVVALLDGPDMPVIQPKLQVGAVNDPAEAEADRIADQVLRNLQGGPVQRREDGAIRRIPNENAIYQATIEEEVEEKEEEEQAQQAAQQRKPSAEEDEGKEDEGAEAGSSIPNAPQNAPTAAYLAGEQASYPGAPEEEEKEEEAEEAAKQQPQQQAGQGPSQQQAQGKAAAEEEAKEVESEQASETADEQKVNRLARRVLRRKEDKSASPGHGFEGGAVDAGVARDIESARGGGKPMEPKMLARMEEGFGADFSGIRVHSGGKAAELNRSLNAQAFTTGSDIFLGSGGVSERVMAHELAHTVQQGAATAQRTPNTINRFMNIAVFEKLTYESTFSMKSTAQNTIIDLLKQYSNIATLPPQPFAKAKVPPDKVEAAVKYVENMQMVANAYIQAKSTDPKAKSKRLAGFKSFAIDCQLEIDRLRGLQATDKEYKDKAGAQDTKAVDAIDNSGVKRTLGHYSGTLSSAMEKAGAGVGALASANGDSGELVIDLDVPVSPGVTVGAHFKFEAKKGGKPDDPKPGPVEVGLELGFTVGGDALFAKIQAGLGGYMKAQGKDATSAMKLLSYGLYRRCRESSVIPAGVGNKLWGGSNDAKGKKKAEDWSLQVEKEEFDNFDNYVETGAYANVKAKGEAGIAEIEGEVKGTMGKRHDKTSLDNSAKGGAGKENTTGDNWFAQKTTGRNVKGLELSVAAKLMEAFGLELKLGFNWRESGKKGEASKLEEFELKASAYGSVPSGSMADTGSKLAIDFLKKVAQLQKGQLQKAGTMSQVGAGVGLAAGIADTTVQGIYAAPTADVLKKAMGRSTEEGGKSLIDKTSRVGLELAYTFKYDNGACYSTFEILHRKSLDAKLPGILEAQLVRKSRLLVGSNQGGSWAWNVFV